MASTSCSVCMYDWSTDRHPLMLECGHSFCQLCIFQLISGTNAPECPLCHTLIKYSSCETIPRNYMLFSEEIRGENNTVYADEEKNSPEPLCTTHDLKLDKWCKTCKICVCSSCSSDDESPHPPSKCKVVDLDLNDVIEASCGINASLLKRSQDIQKRINQCNGFSINFNASLNQKKKSLDHFQEATQKIKPYVKRVKSKLFSFTEELIEQVSLIGESVDTSEVTIHFEQQNKLKIEMENWMDRTVNELPLPTNVDLGEMTGIMKELYAVIQKDHKLLFGRIKNNGDCMNIGSFKESCPPFNSKVIKLSDICPEEKFKKEKNVYLRITAHDYDRMISIKLHENNENADVFFSLCCGFQGENYEGCLLNKSNKCFESTGNFTQKFKYIPSKIIVFEEMIDYLHYVPPGCSKGDLVPSGSMNQILISTGNSLNSHEVFGKVVEPLEIIDYIYDNKCPVIISECGVILKGL